MQIGGVGASQAVGEASSLQESSKAKLQMLLLKKTLDMQTEQADAVLRMAEGKGQNLDIRV